jgi:predicted dehydrogenase
MEKTIRWGIWGTGAIAHQVASDLRLVEGAVLHAVASRTGERAAAFAADHRAQRWYQGLDSLLSDTEVDVVYVATPNHRHWVDCLACIHAGKAVLCEKPLALNHAQAQLVAEASRLNRTFCMEAMWTRFIPAVEEARRLLHADAIGPVRLIQGNFTYPASGGRDNRLFDLDRGGGALLDRGVYLISLAQHLLGVPESIHGCMTLGATGVDEQSSYQLTFKNGALADLASSLLVRGSNDFVFLGERGSIRLSEPFYCAHRLEVRSHAPRPSGESDAMPARNTSSSRTGSLRQRPAIKWFRRRLSPMVDLLRRGRVRHLPFGGNGYQFELMEVDRCLRLGLTESPRMPLNDSLEVLKTMDALRQQCGLLYPQECAELQIH